MYHVSVVADIIYVTISRLSTKLLGNFAICSEQSSLRTNNAYDRFDHLRIRSRVVIKGSQCISSSSEFRSRSLVILQYAFIAKNTSLFALDNRIINITTRNLTLLHRTYAYDGTTLQRSIFFVSDGTPVFEDAIEHEVKKIFE